MGVRSRASVKTKPGETVVFSWIVYKSRAHRDRVNAKVMKDPRLAAMMSGDKKMPFDVKRMVYGGFKVIVEASKPPAARTLHQRERHIRATRREWIGLAVHRAAVPALLDGPDGAEPRGAGAQRRPASRAARSCSGSSTSTASWSPGSLITMGTLGDRIGRRKLLLIGAAAFGVASVLAAFSTSAEMLIATRALLGVAGATLAPSTLSLIRNMFLDPRQRTVAIGVWITSYSAGGAIGPLLGGVAARVLLVGLGVPARRAGDGAAARRSGPRCCPEFRDPDAGRLDLLSAALSLVARAAGDLRPQADRRRTASAWLPALSIVAGVAVGVVFVRRQRTLADPLIDLRAVPRRRRSARRWPPTCSASSSRSASSSSSRSTCSWCSGCRRCRPASGRCRRRSASSSAR